jgi:hypothetical protein
LHFSTQCRGISEKFFRTMREKLASLSDTGLTIDRLDQWETEQLLEQANLSRNGRLRNPEFACRPREASETREPMERFQLIESEHFSVHLQGAQDT